MAILASVTNEQTLEAQVAGPAGATRVIFVTGLADCSLAVSVPSPGGGSASQRGTFEAPVGPALTLAQFRRAIASVSLASLLVAGSLTTHSWAIVGVDADFDEEDGRVRLEFDAHVDVQGPPMPGATQLVLATVAFQVTILAA